MLRDGPLGLMFPLVLLCTLLGDDLLEPPEIFLLFGLDPRTPPNNVLLLGRLDSLFWPLSKYKSEQWILKNG